MTSMLMHMLMAALLIFLGYCLGRADGAMADARRKVGAGRTATEGHNALAQADAACGVSPAAMGYTAGGNNGETNAGPDADNA